MASLHLPYCATTGNTTKPSTTPRRLFPKPCRLIAPTKRLQVSCQKQTSHETTETPPHEGKVDRRNMLVGLSGLYGAANLPNASANPIKPPELDKCGDATINPKKTVDYSCCPPAQPFVDYRLPQVIKPKIRPSAHRVSPEYVFKYNLAIDRMKRLPKDDPRSFMQQANIHCAYCNGAYDQPGQGTLDIQVHNSWLFFPFHRWYLYFYERILGKLINDPTFALPFWNWDNPKGMTLPPIFNEPKTAPALYNPNRNQDHLPPAVVDLNGTKINNDLQVVTNNLTLIYSEMIRSNASATDFMGKPYREGAPVNPGAGSSERGSHTGVHLWVGDPRQPNGEDMGNFYSAGRDPVFYCHHANVDRMWTIWQSLSETNVPDKEIKDPDFLNAAFLFYDENAQLVRVTVKDCVNNLRMGFEYQRVDLPWLSYRPPPQTSRAKINRASTKASTGDITFPLKLDKIVRVLVQKTQKGKADEVLLLENITVETSKYLKFDVFVNDEDDNVLELDKAAFAGTFAQVPHRTTTQTATSSINLKLTDLYEDMDVEDDDDILVTLVPRHEGDGVTIGGIKIIKNPTPATPPASAPSSN